MNEEGRWVTIRGRHVFIKNGQTVSEAIKEYEENKNKTSTTYYRGLTQKYDPNYNKSKLDNPNGYESWTDSLELAKEYAGKNGYVYSVEIPNNELNPDDIYDQDGERSLMYYNDKPVALHGVEGEEFMLYTDHEKWNDLEYKEVPIYRPLIKEEEIMSKLILTKDPSHKGYYQDADGNLYVFRFGGRPIKVDGYRDDKPKENIEAKSIDIDKKDVIDHRKSASIDENNKFIKELETELTKKSNKLSNTAKGAEFNKIEKELDELRQEKKSTIKRLENTKKEFDKKWLYAIDKDRAQDDLSRIREHDLEYNDDNKMSAREFIKKQTGQREMYQSIAKLMNDNEDKLSSEEWKALDNARMILKQNPELIADDSILSDTSKPIHERLSKYMNDNEYQLDSGVWGPLYEANKVLRQNDSGEKTKLLDRYKQSVGVSDDWFTEEARKLKMSDEEIADTIYEKKGVEAQGSTDDNIKRIIAGKEKDKWQKQLDNYKKMIDDPNTGEWDRNFAKSELQGVQNMVDRYADWEAEFIKKANKDDETFIVRYDDGKSTDNFRVVGLKEALNMKEELQKYGDDIHVYDTNGKEWSYDKDRKFYTSPRYEENKRANMINDMRGRLYGADRSTLVSMINQLGLHLNVDNWTTAQLYRILEKELYKDKNNK